MKPTGQRLLPLPPTHAFYTTFLKVLISEADKKNRVNVAICWPTLQMPAMHRARLTLRLRAGIQSSSPMQMADAGLLKTSWRPQGLRGRELASGAAEGTTRPPRGCTAGSWRPAGGWHTTSAWPHGPQVRHPHQPVLMLYSFSVFRHTQYPYT